MIDVGVVLVRTSVSYGIPKEGEVKTYADSKPAGFNEVIEGSNVVQKVLMKYQTSPTIFKNKNALSSKYVPDEILHRESEMEKLTQILAPALRGYSPSNVFIYGSVGTGKTITTKYVLNELNKHIKKNNKTFVIYINCKEKRVSDTEYRLLAQMLKEFGIHVPDTGLSTNVLHRRLGAMLEGKNTIVVLDEVDTLIQKIGDEFLYTMIRADNNLSIIGITNNLMWQRQLDMRVVSSLREEELVFNKYNAGQLYDILKARADEAFHVEVSDAVISKCAALAAQEHGDARRALMLLTTAGDLAERDGSATIAEYHVDLAEHKMDNDRIVESLKGMPRQAQAVLASILEINTKRVDGKWKDNRIMSGDIFSKYRETCKSMQIRELTQRRVCDLIKEIEGIGLIETNVVSHGRHGRKTEIRVALEEAMISKARGVLAEEGIQ